MADSIQRRKSEHIELSLSEQSLGKGMTNGLEQFRFIHHALPEIDFNEITLSTSFFGKQLKTPFLISSMTGGVELAETINQRLAIAAEERGWMLGLGSTRIMLESEAYRTSFQLRKYAPTIPIIANIGAVQLNEGLTEKELLQILEWTEADAFVLHLNTLQEVIQPGGDTNFSNLLPKIEHVVKKLPVPIGVKEVGFGIDGEVAQQLKDVGIQFIDVAGAGGTSWSQIEKLRSNEPIKKAAAEVFASWGNPTAMCLQEVCRVLPNDKVIASGGIKDGMDACKSIALGASHVGFARSVLKEAVTSIDELLTWMEIKELEMQMTMFGIGCKDIPLLKKTNRIEKI
jgi:isopentenyl-diphosphate Delta-isomerase